MSTKESVLHYVYEKYDTKLDYPFHRFPTYAALRHHVSGSWYGLLMNVPRSKLGLKGAGEVNVLDLKNTPAKNALLRDNKSFIPAYHMNKEHWISIVLDDSVPDSFINTLIDDSYNLTK